MAPAPPGAKDGIACAEFVEFCHALRFTIEPRPLDSKEALELDALDREWLGKQSDVAQTLARLREHVLRTGGDAPTAYPSGDLLVRARAALATLSAQLGAYARGKSADPAAVRVCLTDLLATLERGEVAMAVEDAAEEMNDDSDEEL